MYIYITQQSSQREGTNPVQSGKSSQRGEGSNPIQSEEKSSQREGHPIRRRIKSEREGTKNPIKLRRVGHTLHRSRPYLSSVTPACPILRRSTYAQNGQKKETQVRAKKRMTISRSEYFQK